MFITQYLDPTRGGGEVVFYSLAKELSLLGHEIYIIKHPIKGQTTQNELPQNVFVFDVGPALDYKGGLPAGIGDNLRYYLNAVRLGIKLVKSKEVDIIHANNYTPVYVGITISKLTHRPVVTTIHDVALIYGLAFWERWMKQFKGSWLSSIIGYFYELLSIKLPVDAIHTVSDASHTDIAQINRKTKISIIPNGLDLTQYDAGDTTIGKGQRLVYVGRLVYFKNLEVVLKAMQSVLKINPNVQLFVLGDGPLRRDWEARAEEFGIRENVVFKGYVSHREKLSLIKDSRILVQPSLWEGFGMVILEAWALRRPVIVSDLAPMNEIVEDGEDGFTVNPHSVQEWADRIQLMMKDDQLVERLGLSGFRKLQQKYTSDIPAKQVETLYFKTHKK